MSLYLKATRKGRIPRYQGGQPIPYRTWTPRVTSPRLCRSGWHACRWEDVLVHLSEELWVCELDGRIIEGDDKVVAERLRIVRKVNLSENDLRLFAADCAEAVLPLFEAKYPNDSRPRLSIQATRDYANGKTTYAAWDAAGDAARAAAGDAATYAAKAAARAAATYAAWDAVWDAAWDAARAAAGDAARAAAGAAAGAAATYAAWDAARDAAEAAAWAAAWAAQSDNLLVNYANLDHPEDFAHRSATDEPQR